MQERREASRVRHGLGRPEAAQRQVRRPVQLRLPNLNGMQSKSK